jgi:hypothetical protein
MELDPLLVLLDFLVGDSVETLARKNHLPNEHVEQALRAALSSYGFAAERDLPQNLTRYPKMGAKPTLRSASSPGKSS